MIKRTLYFGNPAYLHSTDEQLYINRPDGLQSKAHLEDIGIVILDNNQITITSSVLNKLLQNNAAVITCNEQHMPTGLLLNLDGHTLQSQKFRYQLESSLPLRKNLWKQTIQAKVNNQASMLKIAGANPRTLLNYAKKVTSGDIGNVEAKAAAHYWKNLFPRNKLFYRERYGSPPNNLFNYGYAILRAIVARSLVGSGLLPTLGIFHRNQYNAYCLADDIMEPYRPFVDSIVLDLALAKGYEENFDISKEQKERLLQLPVMDVLYRHEKRPLMVAIQHTTATLAQCFEGVQKKLFYPSFVPEDAS